VSDLIGVVSGAIGQIGLNFFLAYFFPSALFILINSYIVIPLAAAPLNGITANGQPLVIDLPTLLLFIVITLIVSLLLVGLNNNLLLLYSGRPIFLRRFVLGWATRRNIKKSEVLYTNLRKDRQAAEAVYMDLTKEMVTDEQRHHLETTIEKIRSSVDKQFDLLEQNPTNALLPSVTAHIAPNAFGNALAQISEYLEQHYLIDSAVFWPRLYVLLGKNVPELVEQIASQKARLDTALNLSALGWLVCIETIGLMAAAVVTRSGTTWIWLLVMVVVSAITGYSFYRSSVQAVRGFGELIEIAFDYHRHLVLEAFGLKQPPDLREEILLWWNLAKFIRRGDSFYYPKQ
jgi:hypothetical protein